MEGLCSESQSLHLVVGHRLPKQPSAHVSWRGNSSHTGSRYLVRPFRAPQSSQRPLTWAKLNTWPLSSPGVLRWFLWAAATYFLVSLPQILNIPVTLLMGEQFIISWSWIKREKITSSTAPQWRTESKPVTRTWFCPYLKDKDKKDCSALKTNRFMFSDLFWLLWATSRFIRHALNEICHVLRFLCFVIHAETN